MSRPSQRRAVLFGAYSGTRARERAEGQARSLAVAAGPLVEYRAVRVRGDVWAIERIDVALVFDETAIYQ